MRSRAVFLVLLLLSFVFMGFGFSETLKAESNHFLDSPEECKSRIAAFVRINPDPTEKQKIDFILDRIRNSEAVFIRNGDHHESVKAAKWLRWKMYHKQFRSNPIITARDFVQRVASYSVNSGRPYEILLPTRVRLKTSIILMAELDALERAVRDNAMEQALQETMARFDTTRSKGTYGKAFHLPVVAAPSK